MADTPNPRRRDRRVTPHGRRASDALKMTCPFCGACESAVVRSEGRITTDRVRRRRECVECGRRFPTSETVDYGLLHRELTPDERATLRQLLLTGGAGGTWDDVDRLLHELWGLAKDQQYDKARWLALQRALDDIKRLPS